MDPNQFLSVADAEFAGEEFGEEGITDFSQYFRLLAFISIGLTSRLYVEAKRSGGIAISNRARSPHRTRGIFVPLEQAFACSIRLSLLRCIKTNGSQISDSGVTARTSVEQTPGTGAIPTLWK